MRRRDFIFTAGVSRACSTQQPWTRNASSDNLGESGESTLCGDIIDRVSVAGKQS